MEGEGEGEGKGEYGRNWAHRKGEQVTDGKGRMLAGAKGAIELCVYSRFRRTRIIGLRGLFARIANGCFS